MRIIALEIVIHLDVTFQVLGNRERMEQIWRCLQFPHLRRFLGDERCSSSPFTADLMPRLAAALGPKCLLWFLTAMEQGCSCSKAVVSKLERTGFEAIQAVVVSVREEGLQSLLQTVTVTHCVTRDRGLDGHVLQFPFL